MSNLSMLRIYENACTILGWSPRKLINEALRRMDEGTNPLIVKLPTGYGKTSITLSMGLAGRENGANWLRTIHVLPMRSIVDDIKLRLSNNLQRLDNIKVYKQCMGSPSTPFYCGKGIIVTTLDTFVMNLFKIPATEFGKLVRLGYSHYEIPRANIYSSAVVLDEFHLLSGIGSLQEEFKSLSSILTAIRSLCEVGVPLVISTATLPEILVKAIREILRRADIEFQEDNVLRWGESKDESFENSRRLSRVSLDIIEWSDIMKILKRCEGKKILLVTNKVERAVDLFREIYQKFSPSSRIILLHGRLREDVKRRRIEEIDEAKIVISTQIIEAGVDKSFDVLITDPCPLDRFIQRSGRVARFEGAISGEIYVLELSSDEQYSGVYNGELTKSSTDVLKKLSGNNFPKLELEEMLLEKMEGTYDQHVDLELLLDKRRLRVLIDLDEQPLLGKNDAKNTIVNLNGFTNTFGMITVFDASEVNEELSYDFSVGIVEDFARIIFESKRMAIVKSRSIENLGHYIESILKDFGEFKLVSFKGNFTRKLLYAEKPLTISFLEYGIEGLAIERIDPIEGLVRT